MLKTHTLRLVEYDSYSGPVFQNAISPNFNPLFQFVYFCTSVYHKTSETKTPIDPDKISEKF